MQNLMHSHIATWAEIFISLFILLDWYKSFFTHSYFIALNKLFISLLTNVFMVPIYMLSYIFNFDIFLQNNVRVHYSLFSFISYYVYTLYSSDDHIS